MVSGITLPSTIGNSTSTACPGTSEYSRSQSKVVKVARLALPPLCMRSTTGAVRLGGTATVICAVRRPSIQKPAGSGYMRSS